MLRKVILSFFVILFAVLLIIPGWGAYKIYFSQPQRSGEIQASDLNAAVTVRFDRFGVPEIVAENRIDAAFALGFVTAGDRLFQMDLIRRKTAGRLAEIFGPIALANDISQRHMDFEGAARAIVAALPSEQREVLNAYVDGVNAYLEKASNLPPEILVLRYEPKTWSAQDSMLVVLSMFQILTETEKDERMMSIMNQCLPDEVAAFLTPDTDRYTKILTGGSHSHRPIQAVPVEELTALLEQNRALPVAANVEMNDRAFGSNNWAVSRQKTKDGVAMLANDMHLPVSVPNIWYRANLRYAGLTVSGLSLPGVPSIVAGSNGKVAWGFTNFMADVMDLVKLRINPENPRQYLSSSGWRNFDEIPQSIAIKDAQALELKIRITEWGPVAPEALLGQPVAVRWTALDPQTVNLNLMNMDRVATIEEAMDLLNRTGAPPQNVLLADDRGNIGWTLMGRFPLRNAGFHGDLSTNWDDQSAAWLGWLRPEEMPRIINPPEGFLASANSRNIGRDYPHVLGHNFAHAYRTFRISERLENMRGITEEDLFRLQLDSKTEFYEFYRSLALSLLTPKLRTSHSLLADMAREIEAWDGYAHVDSRGLALLSIFRIRLGERVFAPFLKSCAAKHKDFKYEWFEMETPLRQLLSSQIPKTLPDASFPSWKEFMLAILTESAKDLKKRHELSSFENFTWGQSRRIGIRHPLSKALPLLADYLDMPEEPQPGCAYCIRVMTQDYSASERMVISPGRPQLGILHMPAGQSGHFLSPHYADQQRAWAQGHATPYYSTQAESILRLVPAKARARH